MALPNSPNPISMSQIKTELNSSSNSIRTYSEFWGLSAPDSMTEFYGKSNVTYSASRSGTFTRNNCSAGYISGSVTFTKTYTSTISQADADAKKNNDSNFNTEGQAYANTEATCTIPAVTGTYTYGCSGYLNTGYISVSAMGGGLGGPYVWQWKIQGGTYSANKAVNTSVTGLANGLYYIKITDQASNTYKEDTTLAIGCEIEPVSATVTASYVNYEGTGYITVGTITGGDGSGEYYWYLNTDPANTKRAANTTVSNLADGEYIVYLKDKNGNGSSVVRNINAPVQPNATLQVRFKTSAFAIGECGVAGSLITVELNSPTATFDNATSFTSSTFTAYGQGTFGYINYGSKYVLLYHTSNNAVATPGGSRQDCTYHPAAGTDLGPACNGYNYQNRTANGTGGFTWGTVVQYNSATCGYATPSATVTYGCTGYINTGYITVNNITGGTGSPYTWQYRIDGGSWSSSKANNTSVTGLSNGSYQVRVSDKDGNTRDYTSLVIACDPIPAVTATVTASYTGYEGSGYILVQNIAGGDGSGGYYWYTNTDGTARASGTQISNLPDGEYIVYVKDANGNGSSYVKNIDAPPVPNATLSVRFKTTPYGTGECGTGSVISVTLSSPTATFENSSSFTSSSFTPYGQGIFGYINSGSRWLALYHSSNNATATPAAARQDCSSHPAAGTVLSGYVCDGTTKRQKVADGSGGFYGGSVIEYNSTDCGYVAPSYNAVSLGLGSSSYDACNSYQSTYYVPSGYSFTSALVLYNDTSESPAYAGWYSNANIARYWDGSSFTSNLTCGGGGGNEEL